MSRTAEGAKQRWMRCTGHGTQGCTQSKGCTGVLPFHLIILTPLRPTYLSFGDVAHKTSDGSDAALAALPELRTEIITERDELVLLATDGLWDVMDSQNAINMVRKSLNKHHKVKDAVKELVKEAIKLGSVDNVSAVVVVFNQSKEGEAGAGAGARRK